MDMTHDSAIEAARSRRKNLHAAMIDLEEAVQAPARSKKWLSRLRTELGDLSVAFEEHANTVEAPEGIIARVVEDAPRLDGMGKRLLADHDVLREGIASAITLLDSVDTPPTADQTDTVVEQVLDLLLQLSRHRHRGSDFVWEAYDVEIGGG